MNILRTPDTQFLRLNGWSYRPLFTEFTFHPFGSVRTAHYVDGPADGPVVLCLHGEPTWAYLYRHMMPVLAAAGARVVAPDLLGFGQSDKIASGDQISYELLVTWLLLWFDRQNLNDVTLFCQDWGGLLGLRLVAARPERFARVVVANTMLPDGRMPPTEAFLRWRAYSQRLEPFDCGAVVHQGTIHGISPEAAVAYNAPFPDERLKAAPRRLPLLVPIAPSDPSAEMNQLAWEVLERFDRPFLTLFSDRDPVTAPYAREFQLRVPGAEGQPHAVIANAGHFVQEDAGPELARRTLAFMGLAVGSPA
ncbi:MAG: haloalkane dehalogenase [Thermaurantiacus tibetensis]|uniref:haloalkane dehalogenase n=1 Tax=Thermaurantiacus tibetensis TaxID=2759035 RepID=UPI001890348E|nr:haloalkane dehalogenase [Thermaurantiacus tibetensis]